MKKLLMEQYIFIILVVVAFFGGGYGAFASWSSYSEQNENKIQKEQELNMNKDKLQQLEAAQKAKEVKEVKEEKVSQNGKIIYEVPGQQFTPNASFGIMFENLLANITNSGIKIRSIMYNYAPQEDKIIAAGEAGGYNACELSFTAIGSYTQFQNLFKNLAKEKYLSNIYEVYIEPYDKDKTILITKFKVRLYTRTVIE